MPASDKLTGRRGTTVGGRPTYGTLVSSHIPVTIATVPRKPTRVKQTEISKAASYAPPAVPLDSMGRVVRDGILLRQRMVARLELAKIPMPEIAVELNRQDNGVGGWSLEGVLYLTGRGTDGTPSEREAMATQYSLIREEVSHPSIIDVDTQLKENLSMALSTMTALMGDPDPKIRFQASSKVLSLNGTGDVTERKIVEFRVEPKLEAALIVLSQWIKPTSRLDRLLLESSQDDAAGN